MIIQDSIFKFIICGTDTDIGKTLISSFFVRGLNSFYWKPIQSGIEPQTDSQTVETLAQVSRENYDHYIQYQFFYKYLSIQGNNLLWDMK